MAVLEKSFTYNRFEVTYQVNEEHDDMRLDQFLQIYFHSFSRQTIKRKIASGEVIIKNRKAIHRPSTKVHQNEIIKVVVNRTSHEDEYWRGQKLELETTPEIIFEDENIIVISKPAFMSTHPTGRHLFNCATNFFETKYGITIHSVHRLDRETSGILLLAKNPKTAKELGTSFENRKIKKCYFFISIDKRKHHICQSFDANQRLTSPKTGAERVLVNPLPENTREGKHASTHFEIIHSENGYVIGLAFPKTGRQHQIRVHALAHGLPLVGDKIYLGGFKMFQRFKDGLASKEDYDLMQLPRHALHAIAINIPDKKTDKTFISKLPVDLKEWINDQIDVELSDIFDKIKKNINLQL